MPSLAPANTGDIVMQSNDLGYRIRLRLDSRKSESKELVAALDNLVNLASHPQGFEQTNAGVDRVLEKTQVVLETAWGRVRRGEPRFRWVYRIALASLVCSLLFALLHAMAPHVPQLQGFAFLR